VKAKPCVLCGNQHFRIVKHVVTHNILHCNSCGLVFRDPKPSLEEAKAFYREQYFTSSGELTHGYGDYASLAAPTRKLSRRKLNLMKKYVKGGKLLDVGAAFGLFLDEADRAGWQAHGVEISEYAAKVAQKLTPCPVHKGSLEEADIEPESFDVVTLWDVLEHASEIKPFCDRVYEILKPGGYVFVTVPNVASNLARFMGSQWFGYAKVEHIYYYNPSTLRRAFAQSGLELCSWRPWPWACTVDFVARRMAIYSRLLAAVAGEACRFLQISRGEVYFHWIDLLGGARKSEKV